MASQKIELSWKKVTAALAKAPNDTLMVRVYHVKQIWPIVDIIKWADIAVT